jgi:hypothetical protein
MPVTIVKLGANYPREPSGGAALGCAALRKVFLLVLFCSWTLISGCGTDVRTVWSIQAPSPDGYWVASGRADQHSGPGNAAIVMGVYLRRANGSVPEEPVLNFFNDLPPGNGGISLMMRWLTPTHLQVTFSRHPDLYFQVVKYAGIDISVQDLVSAANSN